jgi:hypothetical protein
MYGESFLHLLLPSLDLKLFHSSRYRRLLLKCVLHDEVFREIVFKQLQVGFFIFFTGSFAANGLLPGKKIQNEVLLSKSSSLIKVQPSCKGMHDMPC